MGKIHDALQRAEQARRGVESALELPAADVPSVVAPAPSVAEPAPRTRGWSLRRKSKSEPVRSAARALDEDFVLPAGTASPHSEEFRTLRARIQSLRRTRELRTIVVSSTRPGEGKTTTAVNLALSFGLERENSICLLDA